MNTPPPKDGTPIIACGRITSVYADPALNYTDSFCALVKWECTTHCAWHYIPNNRAISHIDDEVVIDWWCPPPEGWPLPSIPDQERIDVLWEAIQKADKAKAEEKAEDKR